MAMVCKLDTPPQREGQNATLGYHPRTRVPWLGLPHREVGEHLLRHGATALDHLHTIVDDH